MNDSVGIRSRVAILIKTVKRTLAFYGIMMLMRGKCANI